MRLRRLAATLERISPPMPAPRAKLEQYTTPAELALKASLVALERTGYRGAYADLGSGTCRIALALALLGAPRVIAVEADERLCPICLEASRTVSLEGVIEPVCSYITSNTGPLRRGAITAVVMNPPHGVQRRGADREFLEYAFSLEASYIVAIVKAGNVGFHRRVAESRGYEAELLWRDLIEIPASMPHHRSRLRRVAVDVIEFHRRK
ncbi:MAG: hypothetical protein GSR80_001714 [Desulfurococcales archaeon]|nr:hypothetical protein [Desulfurococcales archaeon]